MVQPLQNYAHLFLSVPIQGGMVGLEFDFDHFNGCFGTDDEVSLYSWQNGKYKVIEGSDLLNQDAADLEEYEFAVPQS